MHNVSINEVLALIDTYEGMIIQSNFTNKVALEEWTAWKVVLLKMREAA
jgi:hypothetical protein